MPLDDQGRVCFRTLLSKGSHTSKYASIPLILQFSSSPVVIRGGLPNGWSIPSLDACAWLDNEDCAIVLDPDGSKTEFRRAQNGEFVQVGGKKLELEGDALRVVSKDREVTYKKGRIAELKTFGSSPNRLTWHYNRGGSLEAIYDQEGRRLISCVTKRSGPVCTMILRSIEEGHDVNIQFIDTRGLPLDELERVERVTIGSRTIKFDWVNAGDVLKLEALDSTHGNTILEWLADSGRLQRVNSCPVSITWPFGQVGAVRPSINIKTSTGDRIVQTAISSTGGMRKERLVDGSTRIEYITYSPFGGRLVRKTEEWLANGEVKTAYRAKFDMEGNIISDGNGDYVRKLEGGVYKVYRGGKLIREY